MVTSKDTRAPSTTGVPFGRYLIKRRLGRGGMGEVFLAEQLGPLGPVRPVALKRMLPQLSSDREVASMFLEEMGTAALLNHPNIATTYDFGEVEGVYFLAMELIDGLPLNEIVEKLGALPIPETLAIVRSTLEALEHAHALKRPRGGIAPVVHSDLSPHNLMLSTEGAVKLLDFGLARAEAKALGGPVRGKIGYVAPEQAEGAATDRRFDLWAAGVVLYELAAGVRPFEGDDAQAVLEACKRRRYKPLAEVRPEARALSPIVDRALEPDPAKRFESAGAFLAACAELAKRLPPVGRERLAALVARAGGARRAQENPEVTGTGIAVGLVSFELDDAPTLPPKTRRSDDTPIVAAPVIARAPAPAPMPASNPAQAPLRDPASAIVARAPDRPRPRAQSFRLSRVVLASMGMVVLGSIVGYVLTRRSVNEPATVVVVARGDQPAAVKHEPEPPQPAPAAAQDPQPDPRAAQEAPDPGPARAIEPAPAKKEHEATGSARRRGRSKTGDSKTASSKTADSRTPGSKAAALETADSKIGDSRTADPKTGDSKATASKASDPKPGAPETSAVPSGLGVLSVRSVPWSKVTLDGKSFGEGVVAGKPVPAGRHTLSLAPGNDEYPARTVDIEIKVGIVTKVFVDFSAGTVRIDPL